MPTIDLTGAIYKVFTFGISSVIMSRYFSQTQTPPPPPPPAQSSSQMSDIETKYEKMKTEIEKITKDNTEKQINSSLKKEPYSAFITELDELYNYSVNGFKDKNNQTIDFIEYINKNHSKELTNLCFHPIVKSKVESNVVPNNESKVESKVEPEVKPNVELTGELKHPTILLYLMRCGLETNKSVYEEITCARFLSYDVYSTFTPYKFMNSAKIFFNTFYLPNFKKDDKYKENSYQKFLLESKKQEVNEKRTREELDKLIKNTFNAFIGGLGRILPGGSKSLRNKRKTSNRRRTKRRRLRPRYRS